MVDHEHYAINVARHAESWKHTAKLFAAHCDQAMVSMYVSIQLLRDRKLHDLTRAG